MKIVAFKGFQLLEQFDDLDSARSRKPDAKKKSIFEKVKDFLG